ncbi:MAG: diguanylate cyclase [Planctomycetota bacterium]
MPKLPSNPFLDDQCFRQIVEQSYNAVIIFEQDGTILYWNSAAAKMFGYRTAEALGKNWIDLIVPNELQEEERLHLQQFLASIDQADSGNIFETKRIRSIGEEIWVEQSISILETRERKLAFAIIRDSNDRKKREIELARQASSDSLSGLANRGEFQRKLEENLKKPLALMILDIDRFKDLNDSFGHPVGDAAIQRIAECMQHLFPQAVTVGRLGGDEFGIVIAPEGHDDANFESSITQRFELLRKEIAATRIVDSDEAPNLTASLGVAIGNGTHSARELLTVADKMLYASKQLGRNTLSVQVLG